MSDFWQGKRVAVTGGAGMIGSQLVALLVEAGARVTVIDNLSRGRRENLAGLEYEFCYADLDNVFNCQAIVGQDAVFNLAARVAGMHYNRGHHAEMFRENLLLQIMPLWAAAMWRVPLFLQCSTVCVYPRDIPFPVTEEWGNIGEPEPTNLGYGLAKRMGEYYARVLHEEGKIKVAISRFSNCYGPRDYFDYGTSHVIPALIRRTLEDEEVRVYGTGNQVREFLYSVDAAKGAMLLLEHYAEGKPVNIGTPNARISVGELAKLIQKVLGVEKPIFFDVSIPDGYPKRGCDCSLLEKVTGWCPKTGLVEGLSSTVEWYLGRKVNATHSG